MIIASAIKLSDGSVFVGKRHGDCFSNLIKIYEKTGMDYEEARKKHFNCIQGFINDKLQFLNREEAYYEAFENNQCIKQINPDKEKLAESGKIFVGSNPQYKQKPKLISEDLW